MPGLLYSFSRDIFLKTAHDTAPRVFFPAPTPLPHGSLIDWNPCYYLNSHCHFLPLCFSSCCAFCLEFALLPLFGLCLICNHYILPRSDVIFSLQSLWLAPGNNTYYILCWASSTPLVTYSYTVLYDSDLDLDISSLLDYKFQCLYPALFLIPWCLVHSAFNNNCSLTEWKRLPSLENR